jgi:hypothetical protein
MTSLHKEGPKRAGNTFLKTHGTENRKADFQKRDSKRGAKMDSEIVKAIEKTESASDRSRRVLLVMQVTCILVFMSFWHESPLDWTDSRISLAQAVVWTLDCKDHPEFKSNGPLPDVERHTYCHWGTEPSDVFKQQAQGYLARTPTTPSEARKTLELLQTSNVNHNLNIAVPFLGFTFDINDLSLLGGITFVFLLLWYRSSRWREQSNVRSLFEMSNDNDLPSVYRLLAMTQVLTIPPQADGKKGFWGSLAGVLSWLPVVVQALVAGNDLRSLRVGLEISPHLAIAQVVLGWLLLGLLIGITVQCQSISSEIDRQWVQAFNRKQTLVRSAGAGK